MTEQIVILDFGSQYTQVIARRIRECNVYSIILRYDTPAAEIAALKPKGLILSGGPASVYAKNAPLPDPALFKLAIPTPRNLLRPATPRPLPRRKSRARHKTRIRQRHCCRLRIAFARFFANLPETAAGLEFARRQAHQSCRSGFKSVAVTENSDLRRDSKTASGKFFGLQFHPEVAHTPRGREIIANFVHNICGCGKNWTMHNYIDQAVEEIRAQVGKEKRDPRLERRSRFQCGRGACCTKPLATSSPAFSSTTACCADAKPASCGKFLGGTFKIKLQYEDASKLCSCSG